MSSSLEQFRVGDKVTVHDPVINEGAVTRVGRKYVTVTPENPPAPGPAMRRPGGGPRCTRCRSSSPTVRDTTANPPTPGRESR